jgi:glycosyltransferase involved in cell wall biosynthesis
VSQALLRKLSRLSSNCVYLPNGADVPHFLEAANAGEKVQELERLGHPIVGYSGAVYDWFDVDLVCKLAELHPEYSVLIVGPVGYGLEEFRKHPNITLVGVKKYDVVPKYVAYMDVCLIPFKINRLTLATCPIKLYEYLAAGKPVVSTAVPEVCNNASEFVYVGESREDFIRKVEEAVEESEKLGNEAMVARRVRFAEDNSWEKRLDVFERLLRQALRSS